MSALLWNSTCSASRRKQASRCRPSDEMLTVAKNAWNPCQANRKSPPGLTINWFKCGGPEQARAPQIQHIRQQCDMYSFVLCHIIRYIHIYICIYINIHIILYNINIIYIYIYRYIYNNCIYIHVFITLCVCLHFKKCMHHASYIIILYTYVYIYICNMCSDWRHTAVGFFSILCK